MRAASAPVSAACQANQPLIAHKLKIVVQMTPNAAHIVVIEDDSVTRTALAGYLESFGYRVTVCAGAEAAEKVLGQENPDLLIVDINLSGKDGLEITREQRARSEIGIILLSGRTDDVDRIVGLELLARSSRSVRLTAAGVVFLAEARRIVELSDSAVATARAAAEGANLVGQMRVFGGRFGQHMAQ